MKKILFATAVMLMTALGSSANAELVLTSTNGGSFTFNPGNVAGSPTSGLTSNGDQGLSDVAIYLGYQVGGFPPSNETPIKLQGGSATNQSLNTGTFTFDTVSFGNGVSVDAVANFRLVDATAQGLGHHVVYDLALETTGVDGGTEGSLQSFVGFDFNGDGGDTIQGSQIISGFGTSDIAIGSSDRTLVGDFTFPVGQGGPLTTVAATNSNFEAFSGAIGGNLPARFNGTFDGVPSIGDLAFGAFNDFESRDVDRTDTTAGVFGFRSTSAGTATIPEPSTLMMASMGLGMVAFRRRKRA